MPSVVKVTKSTLVKGCAVSPTGYCIFLSPTYFILWLFLEMQSCQCGSTKIKMQKFYFYILSCVQIYTCYPSINGFPQVSYFMVYTVNWRTGGHISPAVCKLCAHFKYLSGVDWVVQGLVSNKERFKTLYAFIIVHRFFNMLEKPSD